MLSEPSMQSESPLKPVPVADNPWRDGNQFNVCLSDGVSVYNWQFEFANSDDVCMVIDERSPHGDRFGEFMVVAGAALLSRGVTLPEGDEIDAVDGPGLVLELIVELLGRAIPSGPAVLSTSMRIDLEEPEEALAVATLSASAIFQAPWRVQGEVRRANESAFVFDLVFTHGGGSDQLAPRISGTWTKTIPAPTLDDRMSLEGWSIFSLGPRTSGGGLDYGAGPAPWRATTLGELRRTLAAQPPSS